MTAIRHARAISLIAGVGAAIVAAAALSFAGPQRYEEHVTNGVLDLPWENGFGVSNNLTPLTLAPSDSGYMNPSGDHTVGVATNSMAPDSGGIVLTCTDPHHADPQPFDNYTWEGQIYTGDGNTRRGLVVRADPSVQTFNGLPSRFISCYQFVIQSGLFQINFRRLVGGAPTTLRTWFASQVPGGSLPPHTWHKMAVIAQDSTFRCFIDDSELTAMAGTPPVVDATLPTGWAGVYNFSATTGGVPFLVDDLILTPEPPVPARPSTWGGVKARWANFPK